MAESEREDGRLRELFAEVHRASRDRAPAFGSLWARVERRRSVAPPPAGGYRTAVTVLAATAFLIAVLIGIRLSGPAPPRELDRAAIAAAALAEWQAPLDFLLETPGRQWLETTPRWGFDLAIDVPVPGAPSTEEVTR